MANLASVQILRTNGAEETHEVGKQILMDWCKRMIDASTIDTVNLRNGQVMIVDDNGYETETVDHGNGHVELRPVKAHKPVNAAATKRYHAVCRPGTTHEIVGDVAVVWDKDFA